MLHTNFARIVSETKIFFSLHFEYLFSAPVTNLCKNRNHLCNFNKDPPKDVFAIWWKSIQLFWIRCFYDCGRTTMNDDDGQKIVTKAHPVHRTDELKYIFNKLNTWFSYYAIPNVINMLQVRRLVISFLGWSIWYAKFNKYRLFRRRRYRSSFVNLLSTLQ